MKFQYRLLLLVLIVNIIVNQFLLAMCPSPLPEQYQHLQAGNIVAAYVAGWDTCGVQGYKIEDIAAIADKLTHIIYAFMKPDDVTHSCQPHDPWIDIGLINDYQSKVGGNFAKLLALKKRFPHLKVMLSVGGGTYNKQFLKIATDRENLKQFAQSCVNILDCHDYSWQIPSLQKSRMNHITYEGLFDGIDIDWEWDPGTLTSQLSDNFRFFIHELHELLQGRKRVTGNDSLLSVALQVSPHIYKTLPLRNIVDDIDYFNIMAYDFFGPTNELVGFNAPLCNTSSVYSIDGAIQRIMDQGVTPEKMILGIPLYGYVYENSDGYESKIDKKSLSKAISYKIIKQKYEGNPDFKQYWNDFAHVPSLYNQKDRTFISYDNVASIVAKVKFAQDKKMQGVVIWKLSNDSADASLVSQIASSMN